MISTHPSPEDMIKCGICGAENLQRSMTIGNLRFCYSCLKVASEAQPPETGVAGKINSVAGSAIRAAEAILSGSKAGAIRWHGPDSAGQWQWQYRGPQEVAAIIDREFSAWLGEHGFMNTEPMNEARAREVLSDAIDSKDDGLNSLGWYLAWTPKENNACLDGDFTADDLEAIAWWMRNMGRVVPPNNRIS